MGCDRTKNYILFILELFEMSMKMQGDQDEWERERFAKTKKGFSAFVSAFSAQRSLLYFQVREPPGRH